MSCQKSERWAPLIYKSGAVLQKKEKKEEEEEKKKERVTNRIRKKIK